MKPRIREVIVVEGRYDKNVLSQVVETSVITTDGFGIFHQKDKLQFLRRLAEQRGLILLTDSDGAGFVIRNHLKGAIPPSRLKQAYIPPISGKEKRKRQPGKEGLLGVEGMTPEVLLSVLRRAGATFLDQEECPSVGQPITKADLLDKGLIGPNSREKRFQLMAQLELPTYLTANGLLEALNLMMEREVFLSL